MRHGLVSPVTVCGRGGQLEDGGGDLPDGGGAGAAGGRVVAGVRGQPLHRGVLTSAASVTIVTLSWPGPGVVRVAVHWA